MVAEVHLGGRITDELDRRLFRAYCDAWFNPTLLGNPFSFTPEAKLSTGTGTVSSSGHLFNYCLPDSSMAEIEEYHRFIAGFPSVDSPEVFGLHPNADLTYRVKEVSALLGTIVDTQPADAESNSESSTAASKPGVVETREDMIQHKIRERGIAGTGSALKASLRETSQALFDGKVPPSWVANEQAWLAGTLGPWVSGLIDRVMQLRVWLDRGRPLLL
ncbi:dynein heavy chain, outer arm [Phytophthora cinnamomi]|uniref:dynein heavy chain, outer arm n=1 Tax=Phytophthora cinnamomi TaxID=4785 RepID=UPI003559D3F6|nr:dynein heavy chain, outer arm [Phytophthora cinnamomi]